MGSERSPSHSHDPTNRNRVVRPYAVGELARNSETRDSQDRPVVDPAGAGRKNECLSREVCRLAERLRLQRCEQMGRQKSAEAIVVLAVDEGPNTMTRRQFVLRRSDGAEY